MTEAAEPSIPPGTMFVEGTPFSFTPEKEKRMTEIVTRTGSGTPQDPARIVTTRVPDQSRGLTLEQVQYLLNPLRSSRVAKRSVQGKNLSYLEAWDVRKHLTFIFGFANWDEEVLDYRLVSTYEYEGRDKKPMVEVFWTAKVRLAVRDQYGNTLATYTEAAVGSANKARDGAGLGDIHDNALKTAASDALKRCAINLGTQFGLSLYDDGNTNDVVKHVLVAPEGYEQKKPDGKQAESLGHGVGAVSKEEGK